MSIARRLKRVSPVALARRVFGRPAPGDATYYGIFSRESGELLRSFDSRDDAVAARRAIVKAEPDRGGSLAIVRFDERGRPLETWSGEELRDPVDR